MKTLFFFAFCIMAGTLQAQSLKEALYGGRLKNDTGTVLKKTDTLKLRENMSLKVKDDSLKKEMAIKEREMKQATDSSVAAADPLNTATPVVDSTQAALATQNTVPAQAAPLTVKDNTRIWKEYMDQLSTDIRTEVLTSKKIKDGNYSVLIDYEIGIDGQVTVNNVSSDPQNSFLESQIKERITLGAPQLVPALLANGKPRKVSRKQLLTFAK